MYAVAGFKAADVAGAFSSDDFDNLVNVPGYGEVPANVAKVCRLTWACTKQDPLPNPAGHKVIAGAFAAVLPMTNTPEQPGGNGSTGTGTNKPKADGNLAETGSSSSTPILVGTALVAVAVGATALFVVRRRRTTDQA
ncbi:LAETG motif-containing sortase-dependent surface protein [Streptomyces yaanensis]|uniref:LAETG motif-containing sortase-dependent surface protein n=1 Tax=Streptomyces yaanensis TaxID=1142239 RepID=A0ABV7SB86_9ACTN|nr:LAETG motif-containing sortase-dependent surface protein [Streptomyces sp. CGMCC 4.7035]WNB96830.1 LAETG motif-containing sortase-dependent surface protein [Streptomyces sp. CGMCC 4.7035]